MELTKCKLGELITQRREKNDGSDLPICGVSKDGLIPPKQKDADTSIYNVFYRDDFIFNPARMELNSIAINDMYDRAICSSLYEVFYVHRTDLLLPHYLKLIIRQKWFTRYCEFLGQGSAREYCRFGNISEIEIEFPPIEEQQKIVEYNTAIENRIALKQKINDNLEATLTAIFKKMFIEDNTISFCNKKLYELTETIDNRGKTPPNNNIETPYPLIEIASLRTDGRIATYRNCSKFVTEEVYNSWFRSGHPKQKDILMSTVGSLAELKLFWGDKGSIAQNIVAFRCYDNNLPMYLYQYLLRKQHELAAYEIGSVQASIKVSQVIEYDIAIPPKELLDSFDKISTQLTELIYQNEADIDVCHKLSDTLLQRLTLQD